jgi:hypothetical protein
MAGTQRSVKIGMKPSPERYRPYDGMVLTGYDPETETGFPLIMRTSTKPVVKIYHLTANMLRKIFERLDSIESGHHLSWGLFLICYDVVWRELRQAFKVVTVVSTKPRPLIRIIGETVHW